MIIAALILIATGAVLIVAATSLTAAADAIAERSGTSRLWIGAVLVAGATSLPELAVDVSAVRMAAPNIAAGDLFGSSMANMLVLALIDLWPSQRRLLRSVALDHSLAACFAIVLGAIAALAVLLRPTYDVFGLSLASVLLVVVYLAGIRVIYRQTEQRGETPPAGHARAALSLRGALARLALSAVAILASAPWFAFAAKELAELSGLTSTFVGTFLVGMSTSAPELVSSLAAVRIGAFDLAVGNLFGSNAFNMIIFFVLDLVSPGPLFASLDPAHAVTALFGIVLMALGAAAIVYRAERRYWLVEPDSLLMVVCYLIAAWLIFVHASPSFDGHPVP